MKYYCECCKYDAKVKSSFEKHLKTKKHAEATKSQHLVNQKSPFYKNIKAHHFNVIIVLSFLNLNSQCTNTLNIVAKKTRMKI